MVDTKIKVVLVEDSGLMRILISEILRNDPEIDLVATAKDGREGVEKVLQMKPDVVVTDVMMPEYDGLYVVKQVLRNVSVPVILLSSLDRADSQIFEALQAGAFDFVDKPSRNESRGDDYPLVGLVKLAARGQAKNAPERRKALNSNVHTFGADLNYDVVVIGASTGGPGAVEYILDNLPKNFAIPVVIAQHMPERFIATFAERLNNKGVLKVKIAEKGESLKAGLVYLAPGHANLRIVHEGASGKHVFSFTEKKYKEFNCPSVDCLFESVADVFGARAIAVILTGMGKDGTDGIQKIKGKGGYTIGQDESTSVVFGMPKAANDAGAVKQMLKLQDIPAFIVHCIS